jgi:hypothetical protein
VRRATVENLPCLFDEFGDPASIDKGQASPAAAFANRLFGATKQRGDLLDSEAAVHAQ